MVDRIAGSEVKQPRNLVEFGKALREGRVSGLALAFDTQNARLVVDEGVQDEYRFREVPHRDSLATRELTVRHLGSDRGTTGIELTVRRRLEGNRLPVTLHNKGLAMTMVGVVQHNPSSPDSSGPALKFDVFRGMLDLPASFNLSFRSTFYEPHVPVNLFVRTDDGTGIYGIGEFGNQSFESELVRRQGNALSELLGVNGHPSTKKLDVLGTATALWNEGADIDTVRKLYVPKVKFG